MKTANIQVVNRFRELLRRFEREIFMQNSEACCSGVTLAQCHTLLEVESRGSESLTELAKTLGLDKSTVSRTVDGLVQNGLLDRTIPAENRRMSTIQLTEEGKCICNSINHKNNHYFDDVLSILKDDEKEQLIGLLEKVINRMILLRSQLSNTCSINPEK